MHFDYLALTHQDRQAWEAFCPINSFVVVGPNEFSFPIPATLLNKALKIVVTSSGYPGNDINFYMANLLRIDGTEIDQTPFGFAFVGSTTTPSGYLIQHGNWINRTTKYVVDRTIDLETDTISFSLVVQDIPDKNKGHLSDLQIASHRNAFTILAERIKLDL